ncbi:hypothetical protein [Klebsiella aerogenes]|uniref:Uncharacterized protein n=1 Tax=Klebsiella aerogenes TaxID=548 RepID=A0AAW9LNW3_KLEAE|nr:hypothetical protein [Klebsiella aerogenes]MEA8799850.1 hypothetical protein [Klebsiella aerogenes]
MNNELTAALLTIEKCRELTNCPAGVDLQDWVKQLAAESLQWQMSIPHRIVAGIKADGVEMFALMFAEEAIKDNNITTGWKARASRAASEYAELLREGADKC